MFEIGKHSMRRWFVLLAAPLLAAVSCPKVAKPTSDSRAPSLVWTVLNKNTGESHDFTGNPTINARPGDSYFVVLKANNPGGVHQLTLDGAARWKCASKEPIPQLHDATRDVVKQTRTLTPDADGSVETSDLVSANIDVSLDCLGDWFDSGHETFVGTASNYYGGTATATLDFNVSASWSCASTSSSITVYGGSYEEASASLGGACKFEGAECGWGTPACRPVEACGDKWGCSSDLWRSILRSDDLPANWKAAWEDCRLHSEAGKAAEVTCYKAVQCQCGAGLPK